MSARSRNKGARGEREAAEVLREVYPGADRAPMQARGAKRDGCEVVGTPWHVEVKIGARPPVLAAMRQAIRDSKGARPLVLTRQDRGEWLATLRWEDLAALLRQAERASELAEEGRLARAAAVQMAGQVVAVDEVRCPHGRGVGVMCPHCLGVGASQ